LKYAALFFGESLKEGDIKQNVTTPKSSFSHC